MNNLGILQKLIEQLESDLSTNNKLVIALSIFVLLNFILTAINIYFQFKLKDKDKEINHHNLRESKRIENQEKLYIMLESLTYYDGSSKAKTTFKKTITEINQFLTQKKIYLNKDIISISQEFTDYNTQVLVDYRKKNYEKEMIILEKYNNKFNDSKS
ncbi:conserved hypothetical protein [Tenacibaculum maritimum]|uniref:hypothetical protein n=1 Tax=Tenacibaculum maritimum TaxID=107401 RepID=UPI0012E53B71|nr:hypothetical protein [Tenacibaculum maritimum]CAA0154872.1 conserved hypothetical protein [Tenacibaculum maritimum]